MKEQSSKPTSPKSLSIIHSRPTINWTVDTEQDLNKVITPTYTEKIQMERPKPKFDNKVDEIIDTLEHDNDGPYFEEREVDLATHMGNEMLKDMDEEIMKQLIINLDNEMVGGK